MGDSFLGTPVSVTVKRFNEARGFGFVAGPDLPSDAFLHISELRDFGISSLAEGATLEVRVEHGDRGLVVVEVLSLKGECDVPAEFEGLVGAEVEAGRVIWFSDALGYGFVLPFGRTEAAFLGRHILTSAAIGTVAAGEAVAIRMARSQRGLVVTEVLPWDVVRAADEAA